MTSVSKNHHFIPRSILRKFCFDGSSLLLFDGKAPEKGYRQRNIEKAFQKFHANTVFGIGNEKTDFIEKWLGSGPIDFIRAA